jgi:hypothetical protein
MGSTLLISVIVIGVLVSGVVPIGVISQRYLNAEYYCYLPSANTKQAEPSKPVLCICLPGTVAMFTQNGY